MAQPQRLDAPLPPLPESQNPMVAAGRKLKSVLSSNQQSSVRIRRGPPAKEIPRRRPVPSKNGGSILPMQEEEPAKGSWFSRNKTSTGTQSQDEYDQSTVDLLDVVDPEVSTLSTLTNVQNSLFVPSLGKFVNRRPAYTISETPEEARTIDKLKNLLKKIAPSSRTNSTKSPLPNAQYAILPDDERLEDWTTDEKEELDDLVRHKLHSRRAKFKRSMRGFWQYVRRPLGLFITVYATLITLFGAAWVFFLIGWISLGSKQDYVVNVVDNVLVALFAIIGDGLAPFRAVDTYHMAYIAHYHHKTLKNRKKLGLPDLADHNDLPEQSKEEADNAHVDLESLVARKMPRGIARKIAPRIPKKYADRIINRSRLDEPSHQYSVLTDEEQAKLEYHERKFSKSHTFYKPHETETHYAFPFKLLIAIVLILDLHSCLQITLGACTWGIPYETRPFALTTVILCFSITANITGGILISVGDKRTRKKEVIERMMRQELTSEAIEEMETRWMKEAEERGDIHPSIRKRLEQQKEEQENEEIKQSWKSVPMLPKTLLGKGQDHRQPSLPQGARRSSADIGSSSTPKSSKTIKRKDLPSLHEQTEPARPEPALRRAEDPAKPGRGRKILEFVRKADLDRS